MEYEKVSQKFTNPRNGKEKRYGEVKRLWEVKKHVDYDSFMREKFEIFFFKNQGTHSHAWLLDFLSDLAWPCLVACFSV